MPHWFGALEEANRLWRSYESIPSFKTSLGLPCPRHVDLSDLELEPLCLWEGAIGSIHNEELPHGRTLEAGRKPLEV